MKKRALQNLGLNSAQIQIAQRLCGQAASQGVDKRAVREALRAVVADPDAHLEDPHFAELAEILSTSRFKERSEPAPWAQWGEDLDANSIAQMQNACRLPVAYRGALMPDAHLGYGLPIGGVLATRDAVIPYAVGVDIACRMRLSVLDLPEGALQDERERSRLKRVLEGETRFGIGASFSRPHDHEVLDQDWSVSPITQRAAGKARKQLGSSGSGNHFVEYGVLTLEQQELGLKPGSYLALLSHSGSRGVGAQVASHYSRAARELHPELPDELKHLSWLEMSSELGQEYWAAMNLMGDYAAANHEVIHREMIEALGATALATVENHHNFCIAEDQLVPTPSGPKRIDSLGEGDQIYSMDESGKLIVTEVLDHWLSGQKETLEIETSNRTIRCTPSHRVLTITTTAGPHPQRPWMDKARGELCWKPAGELERGDVVVCATGYYDRTGDITEELARFCGAFLADGWVRHKMNPQGYDVGLAIGASEDAHTARYKRLVEGLFASHPEWPSSWRDNAPGAFGLTCTSKFAHGVICGLGLGDRSRDRKVPQMMFRAPRATKLAFLSGYVDGDGSVSADPKNHGRCRFASVSRELIVGLREIALGCGLRVTPVRREERETNFGEATVHLFAMAADSCSELDLWHEAKAAAQRVTAHTRPEGLQLSARGYVELEESFFAQRVRAIRPAGEVNVYDITVDAPSHCFVCEGIVVHNCWREVHDGQEVYVHRKGATPAGQGVLGIIPGSMVAPAYVVRGRGEDVSLKSASHGAGRAMSRTQAKKTLDWRRVTTQLERHGVELLSAGLDEAPDVYKDIDEVMAAQTDLVDIVARFTPKIVKMAPAGERPED